MRAMNWPCRDPMGGLSAKMPIEPLPNTGQFFSLQQRQYLIEKLVSPLHFGGEFAYRQQAEGLDLHGW